MFSLIIFINKNYTIEMLKLSHQFPQISCYHTYFSSGVVTTNEVESAWDKSCCARKNVLKYLDIIQGCLDPDIKRCQSGPAGCAVNSQPVNAGSYGVNPLIHPLTGSAKRPLKESSSESSEGYSKKSNPLGLLTPDDFAISSSASITSPRSSPPGPCVSGKETASLPRRPEKSFSARAKKNGSFEEKEKQPLPKQSSLPPSSSSPSDLEMELQSISRFLSDSSSSGDDTDLRPKPTKVYSVGNMKQSYGAALDCEGDPVKPRRPESYSVRGKNNKLCSSDEVVRTPSGFCRAHQFASFCYQQSFSCEGQKNSSPGKEHGFCCCCCCSPSSNC